MSVQTFNAITSTHPTDQHSDRPFSTSLNLSITGPLLLKRSEVLAAMSFALDITEGQPYGHAARSCMIAMRLADVLGLEQQQRHSLYYATLLKDLGCSSNAAKMAYLFGSDERRIKRDVKQVDWARLGPTFRFVTQQVAPEDRSLSRLLKLAAMLVKGPRGAAELVEIRCQRGADLARQLGFDQATADSIRDLDEHWNGRGNPRGLRGENISLLARIASVAQTAEVFHASAGQSTAKDIVRTRRRQWFDPKIADAFLKLDKNDTLWEQLQHPDPGSRVIAIAPNDAGEVLDEEGFDRICEAFANVVDAKSPWTYRHSAAVANIAVGLGETMGFDSDSLRWIRRIGLLHDLGKLGVSNAILDKPGKPTDAEFDEIRKHPAYTLQILSQVESLTPIAELAAAHHERLDGRGYHLGIPSVQLPIAARLMMVADIYEALTAARPYRDGMPQEKALTILNQQAGSGTCPISLDALNQWLQKQQPQDRVQVQLEAIEQLSNELK